MPKVTSCPTSCPTMLRECSVERPQRTPWTWRESFTAYGMAATACTLTSASTPACLARALWQSGGTVAWVGPGSTLLRPPSATFWEKSGKIPRLKEGQPLAPAVDLWVDIFTPENSHFVHTHLYPPDVIFISLLWCIHKCSIISISFLQVSPLHHSIKPMKTIFLFVVHKVVNLFPSDYRLHFREIICF